MFGRFTEHALKHDWIEYMAGASMIFGAIILLSLVTYYKKWGYLWREWFTSVDHKRVGMMYLVVSFVMLFKGLVDAGMMRAQQALAYGDSFGYLHAPHFQQIFTAHGVTMILFVGMGVMIGLINLVLPLQIGARDVAFPVLNNISFWLFTFSGMYIFVSLVIGFYAGTGWSSYPPLAGIKYNPGVGVDYWIWTMQISGIGSMLSGINFLVTILKMRCPGMTLRRMPIFVWAVLATVILMVFSFPILTANIAMLSTDRLIDTKIFTADYGGSPMMFINLFWAWGHPEVYILVLPAFGIFSEIVPVFSQKRLFGYTSMVWAIFAIVVLSFIVWLHHFFTMGAGANVNAFFGIMTMIIAVPTGVKIFNWLFTVFRGKIKFTTPMMWFFGFVFVFTVGGMTGVLMSIPAADFQIHNSLFLIAHFHFVIIGGVLFGFFAGFAYWFPKFMGFRLNEAFGKVAFWLWTIGFVVAFFPLFILGFMGATRRMNHYDVAEWQPLFIVAALGAVIIFIGVGFQALQIIASVKQRDKNRDTTGDPWNGRNLEWSTTSPPPVYNFATIPEVGSRDPFWEMKKSGKQAPKKYEEIHMPKNSAVGFFIGLFSFICSFGLIWWVWWLGAIGAIGIVVSIIVRFYVKDVDYYLSAEEVEKIEKEGKS